jgi:hypothetical protein
MRESGEGFQESHNHRGAGSLQKLALSDVRIASLVVVFRGLIGSQKRMKQFICPGLSTARPLALAALSNLALYRDGF